MYQLFLTISILIAQIVSHGAMLGTDESWPLLFVVIVIPALLQTLLLPFCGDSPRYLMEKNREEASKNGEDENFFQYEIIASSRLSERLKLHETTIVISIYLSDRGFDFAS